MLPNERTTRRVRGADYGVGFALFIDGGRLAMLEGFTYDDPWPAIEEILELGYMKGAPTTA